MYDCFRDAMEMDRFRRGLFGGTEAIMMGPRADGETNMEGFNRTFSDLTGMAVGELHRRFSTFYAEVFPGLSCFGKPAEGAADFIARAVGEGYVLCLATNPIFGEASVVGPEP